MKSSITLRPLKNTDLSQYTDMLYESFNHWYWLHGWGKDYFGCQKEDVSIFYNIYNDLTPGCSIAAFDEIKEKLMGACFYHPREHHVSLGIMAVHPDHGKKGVGRLLVDHILNYTKNNDFPACRVVSSAMNMDSFSLYNRAGFIPRRIYHDMLIEIPKKGLPLINMTEDDRVRIAIPDDIQKMGDLEMVVSGIKREIDYRYAMDNPRKVLHVWVYENDQKGIDGYMISLKHPALNMLGPCVAWDEKTAIALIQTALKTYRGTSVLSLIPAEKRAMVETIYRWGARNCEIHLQEAWGKFQKINGVTMPSFLPETG